MSNSNKSVVRRYLLDVLGGQDVAMQAQLVEPDAVFHGPVPDARFNSLVEALAPIAKNPGSNTVTVLDLVAEGDRVAARWMITAVAGASGEARPIRALSVFRLDNGRISSSWTGTRSGEMWVN